jgi:hypothetical protein
MLRLHRSLPQLFLGLALLLNASGQDATSLFRKAPPDVDEALRKTAGAFFEMQVAKKYGSSVKYVAEESLDVYIGSEKDSCFSIEIMSITYNDSFDDATVAILCERGMATPVGGGRVTMPTTTSWRVIDGEWKWYVPKVDRPQGQEYVMTPFGPVPTVTPDMVEGAAKPDRSDTKLTPKVSVEDVKAPLKTNPSKVILRADEASTVTAQVFNSFPGLLKVSVKWVGLKGLSASIDKEELNANEVATVTIKYEPQGIMPPPKVHAVWIETNPMRSATPIYLEFRYEEEMEGAQKSGDTEK